jgi:excisionase family DNA binding protein
MLERSYSPKEAGKMLGVTTHTTQVWDRRGRIRCLRLPTGRRRIPESEVKRILGTAEQTEEASDLRQGIVPRPEVRPGFSGERPEEWGARRRGVRRRQVGAELQEIERTF